MSDTEAAIESIQAMSIEPSKPEIPDFVLVANPFPLPIEEVIARAYENCPLYDDYYGLTGGITRDGGYFEAMVYDHGRETSGFDGRLWSHKMPYHLCPAPGDIESHHNGWLVFDFGRCCGPANGDWRAVISKMVKMLRNDEPYGGYDDDEAPQFDYKPLHPPYFKSNAMIGRPTVKVPVVTKKPITELTWSLPEAKLEVTDYLLVPMPFTNSAMDIATVLYPLYIEEAFVGFTVDDSDTYYEIRSHHTRHDRNVANQNMVSLKMVKGYDTMNIKALRAALPTEYKGGYFILKNGMAGDDTLKRIEKLTGYKFYETEWRSTIIEPPNVYYTQKSVFVPTNIEMYKATKDLYERM